MLVRKFLLRFEGGLLFKITKFLKLVLQLSQVFVFLDQAEDPSWVNLFTVLDESHPICRLDMLVKDLNQCFGGHY